MPHGPGNYQTFGAGEDDPRKLYRTIEDIRKEQAEQGAKITSLGEAVGTVAEGQKEIMECLRGGLKGEPGLRHRVDGHGERLDDHGQRIKSLEESRTLVMPIVEARNERKGLAKIARDNAASTIGGGVVIGLWIAFKAWWESMRTGGHP